MASVVPRAEGLGEGETKVPASLYPAPWRAAVLGPAALVTRPGQAEAEKPGSMEERGHESRDGGPGVGDPGTGQGPWWGGAQQGCLSWAWSGWNGLGVAFMGLAWPRQA